MQRLLTFLILVLIINACSKDASLKQDNFKATELIEKYNEGKLNSDQTSLIAGMVDIVSTNQEILLFVNLAEADQKLFILQHKNLDRNNKLKQQIKDAQVLFFKRNLIVRTKDGHLNLLFHLDQDIPNYLKDIRFTKTIRGYGLALQENFKLSNNRITDFAKLETVYQAYRQSASLHSITNRSDDGPTILAADVQCKCCQTVVTTSTACTQLMDDDCDAGGYGATSCSLTVDGSTCNVSCGEDSTPCCWEAMLEEDLEEAN